MAIKSSASPVMNIQDLPTVRGCDIVSIPIKEWESLQKWR